MPAIFEAKARRRHVRRYRTLKRGTALFACAIVGKKGPRNGHTVCWPRHVKHALT